MKGIFYIQLLKIKNIIEELMMEKIDETNIDSRIIECLSELHSLIKIEIKNNPKKTDM